MSGKSILCCIALAVTLAAPLAAQNRELEILKNVGIDQHLDTQIPRDIVFKDEYDKDVHIGDYFGERPVILAFVYYECPMLCTMVLNGLVSTLKPLKMEPGKDFEVVIVSFDPNDSFATASVKKQLYVKDYGRMNTVAGWHFLTGKPESIKKLTETAGFHYAWDPETQQWAHAAAIMVLTPEGRLSRYLYGIEYPTIDVRLGLVEASHGKIGSLVEQALLYCYHYDPVSGKYGFFIMNIIRFIGIVTVLALAIFMWTSLRREKLQAANNA